MSTMYTPSAMSLLLVATGAFLLVQGLRLSRNIAKARATGLRVVVTPLLETQVLAQLVTPFLRALYSTHLDAGKGWPRWCRFMIKDWSWEDKRFAHEEYGDTFICVSPEGMICYSADAALAWDVMNRRYDFTKPRDKYSKSSTYHDLQKANINLNRDPRAVWTQRSDRRRC